MAKKTFRLGITANKPSSNGTVYDKQALQKAIDKYNKLDDHEKLGYYGKREGAGSPPLCESSFTANNVRIDNNNNVFVDITSLNNPKGIALEKIIDDITEKNIAVKLSGIEDDLSDGEDSDVKTVVRVQSIMSIDIVH